MNESLFPEEQEVLDRESERKGRSPLADRMRPRTLAEVVGQDHLLGEGRFLSEAVQMDELPSIILWGPPGVGKTTIARIIARETKAHFVALSAVLAGVKDVRKVIEEGRYQREIKGRRTILFVDEIHRFNKAQQDAFLAHVEDGTLTLIGATTENPSFEVIAPLLSRTRVLVLHSLGRDELETIVRRALEDRERGLGKWRIELQEDALEQLLTHANGDARSALNSLELAARIAWKQKPNAAVITVEIAREALQQRTLLYDKAGEEHFNLISALHKSIRNSDVDAALYWLVRMLEAGEAPLYVARRLVRIASEDIGLADPEALRVALDAMQAFHFLGSPEGELALAQAAVYLAQAPKSNALYVGYSQVAHDVRTRGNEPVPLHLRNAPTRLMKDLGYGKGYRYAHDEETGVAAMNCLPPGLQDRSYFRPSSNGLEKTIGKRIRDIRKRKEEATQRRQTETEQEPPATDDK